ncbi:alpha/beta hydrolase [Thiosulfatimonas sediminis]|uniref:Alpha/beta hydrolase n=1 Tax=Thiosulfatimonas sediminis TaxID=2675054 RepID=A0A6F8PXG5_9GAMM|nr:alpha/beta fold hydrolase [Thiosulfatimonas sediminis]BBP46660.1 alpha/beta hydrolase [Thiosulfatimonas sediminis]
MLNNRKSELIVGPSGDLEVEFIQHPYYTADSVHDLVIISHPHPLYGGTMDNKVVSTLFKVYQELGFSVVRYNFRGVGQSQGLHDYALGELEDLLTVSVWALNQLTHARLHLAGFSFGSYIALKASPQLKPISLLTVAPPIGLYDFSPKALGALDKDTLWTLIQGGQDEIIDSSKVLEWARSLPKKPDLYWREQASHFFHGELVWLKRAVGLAYR